MPSGTDIIQHYVSTLPNRPGVYRMMDVAGQVLYVGKARDLKNRVANYTSLAGKNNRLSQMILKTASMEFVTTRNEAEALLLEANLIKKLEPRYNILLRDDKSFPYLVMSDHPFTRISKYRGAKNSGGTYFGPFASAGDVTKTIKQLQRAFLLRPCTDTMFESRKRPCLQYQIKRCSAPCVDYISQADYAALTNQATRFMRGQSTQIQEDIAVQMQQASVDEDFELAAKLRDRLRALSQIQREQKLHYSGLKNTDAIAITRDRAIACVQCFFFRDGQNFGNQSLFLKITDDATDASILEAFLPQFYEGKPVPKELLLSHKIDETALIEEALSTRIHVPERGEKREAMKQVMHNAKQALQRHIETRMSQERLLNKLKDLFDLTEIPQRIEVYDNSHISGTHAVGGMIVATAEGFAKNQYRKFTIKTAAKDDDFGMMREVLTRRLKRFKEEENPITPLLLIDGGKGQLSSVKEVMQQLELWGKIPVVAISKGVDCNAGREKFHLEGKAEFQLPPNDPVLHYLQRLRDEAHRFAISAHRNKRSSAIKKSALDEITGVGSMRKKALLQHFGSAKAVANASVNELAEVAGLNLKTAEKIWQQFHH